MRALFEPCSLAYLNIESRELPKPETLSAHSSSPVTNLVARRGCKVRGVQAAVCRSESRASLTYQSSSYTIYSGI